MPVVHETTIRKGLSQAAAKIEDEMTDKNLNFDAEISESEVKAKVPKFPPGAEERDAHSASHRPLRRWCPHCVGEAHDPHLVGLIQEPEVEPQECVGRKEESKVSCQSLQRRNRSKVPTTEFDDEKASGKVRAAVSG